MTETTVDLELDLNSDDDTGLPWAFVDEAAHSSRVREGRLVRSLRWRTSTGEIVHVRPLPSPVSRYRHLLGHDVA